MQKDSLQNRNGVVKTLAEWESLEVKSQPVEVEAPVKKEVETKKKHK